jgi:hypothetical protein
MTERDFLPPRKPHEMPLERSRLTRGERHWNGERWVYPHDVTEALRAATDAIHEYCACGSSTAEAWLLKAHEANQK